MAPKSLEQRFWSKVNKDGSVPKHRPDLGPCWEWTASTRPCGYGQFSVSDGGRRRLRGAHQIAFELAGGVLCAGQEVCHSCDNRLCVRPDHLFGGTREQNVRDAWQKGRGRAPAREVVNRGQTCKVPECRRAAHARRFCRLHYGRWYARNAA